ncbi:hypothetical protein EPA93_03150 [Ktedonosporobacter rubrisoli]|uniref:Pyrrolo-quinoline quinone repeat domain-containing protein n=1 Tax=Ktedonosporobacter rubrisoli TaxID=2509675 RepID=A0A4P6JJ48_KTERU|nr:PQQ-binding-like beta-propeller repeat protein [Ktedonosporobacter rubrisoli]QBD75043.1 hypothetical protein EPA93_03150 [Ktedonosporobacter rubrisoli]
MIDNNEQFYPDMVDEQVTHILSGTRNDTTNRANARLIHGLKKIYAEDAQRLERIWERISHEAAIYELDTPVPGQQLSLPRPAELRPQPRHFSVWMVSGLVATLFIASSLLLFMSFNRSLSALGSQSRASGTASAFYLLLPSGVAKVDARTGHIIWHYSSPSGTAAIQLVHGPLVTKDTIFMPASDSTAYALDADRGTQRWSVTLEGLIPGAKPQLVDNVLYLTGATGIYALNPANGKLLHRYNLPPSHTSSSILLFPAAVGDGMLYIADIDKLSAVSLTDGKVVWSKTQGTGFGQPIFQDGVLYVAGKDKTSRSYVYAFKAASGEQLWKSTAAASICSILASSTAIYCGDRSGNLYAFSKEDGKTILNKAISGFSGRLIGLDSSTLYVNLEGPGSPTSASSSVSSIAALDANTGNLQWKYSDINQPPTSYWGKPEFAHSILQAYIQNGIICVTEEDGVAFALDSQGKLLWQNTSTISTGK